MAAAGGRRVAVGDFGAILQSGTGATLRADRSPTGEILRGVTYGDGRFVAVGSGGVVLQSSGSPRSWRSERSRTAVDLRGVAWTGRRFVAVGDEGTVIESGDGRSWQLVHSAMPCALLGLARGDGRLVAVGGDGTVLVSRDGRRWSRRPRPTSQDLYGVAHGDDRFVTVGSHGAVLSSRDGRRWTRERPVTGFNLHTVIWTGSEYLAGGDRGRVLSSRDGRHWTVDTFPGYHAVRAFATHGRTVVAAGSGTVARRGPGHDWDLESVGFQHFWTGVAYGNGRFVIVGHNGTALLSGDAGATWVPVTTGVAVNLDAVIWSGTRFIATGQGTAVASLNGTNWQPIDLGTLNSVRAMTLFGGHVIGVGDQRTIVQVQ
jgi:hypothetical protein